MSKPITLLDGIARALDVSSESFERGVHWRACLLWPDPEKQFDTIYPALRGGLKAQGIVLYRLGDYDPEQATGPAIWLRALLDASLEGASPPTGMLSVFLLPGVSSADLRHAQTLPPMLRPLAELQYRGDIFRNRRQARDWSVGPFLRSPEQGLGLDVATDSRTDEAAFAALPTLLTYPLADFPNRRLTSEDFLRLIVPDELQALLVWMSDPARAKSERAPEEWESVRRLVKDTYGVDIAKRGQRDEAMDRLARREGVWRKVYARIEDAPMQHLAVLNALRARENKPDLFGEPEVGSSEHNVLQEQRLADDLARVADLPHAEAIARVLALDGEHTARRTTIWAKIGEAPLAWALAPLARLADEVRTSLPGSDVPGLAQAYADAGYAADAALIDALASAGPHAQVVRKVARALYLPWVDPLANRFRAALEAGGAAAQAKPMVASPGTCILFVDGLRMDVGRRLLDRLSGSEQVSFGWRMAPIPTVTATAKPLVTPVADSIRGAGRVDLFLPLEIGSGKPADTACLVAAMRARSIDVMGKGEVRGPSTPQAIGWCECGNLDKDGHDDGERLPLRVAEEVEAIAHRVEALRRTGWQRVRILTDHGWLLVPGGLPKAALAKSTTQTNWSRVALLADGSAPEASTLPWAFDASVRIAVPPGAHAFRGGEPYAHGGVSLQECIVPDILVGNAPGATASAGAGARIASVLWRRYRLSVTLDREAPGHEIEIRRNARDAESRIDAERIGGEGARIDLRVDPDLDEETPVVVVLLDPHGSVMDARDTAIGVN